MKKNKDQKKEKHVKIKPRVSKTFVYVLSIVSILGFFGIMMDSFFGINLDSYVAFAWLLTMGVGFIIESKPGVLYRQIKARNEEGEVPSLTTFVVGIIAVIAGVLSLPQISIDHPVFMTIQGVISFIAIVFIAVQTWVINNY